MSFNVYILATNCAQHLLWQQGCSMIHLSTYLCQLQTYFILIVLLPPVSQAACQLLGSICGRVVRCSCPAFGLSVSNWLAIIKTQNQRLIQQHISSFSVHLIILVVHWLLSPKQAQNYSPPISQGHLSNIYIYNTFIRLSNTKKCADFQVVQNSF